MASLHDDDDDPTPVEFMAAHRNGSDRDPDYQRGRMMAAVMQNTTDIKTLTTEVKGIKDEVKSVKTLILKTAGGIVVIIQALSELIGLLRP